MLVLHNTATRRKEPFEPLEPGKVSMYVCGPTVYDRAHIGNARPPVVFDVLARLLRRSYALTYVSNVTDVEDKINAAAKANGEPIQALTARTEKAYRADVAALGVELPDATPRVTEHIPEIVAMIERLIAGGHAYEAEGHVLFSVPSMPDYGRFSGRSVDELIAGARVDVAPYKRDPTDFVLWKPSTDDLPGWPSPWGRGRPGWHIECSAMIERMLGPTIDIHGGGSDLMFPHHENEIAQSQCAHGGAPLARTWLHNGMLTGDGEKMSKSLGNFLVLGDVLQEAPGEAVRYYLLKTHYRQSLDWTADGLRQARQELDRFYRALRGLPRPAIGLNDEVDPAVLAALEDDLNTPQAIAELHRLVTELNKADDTERPARAAALLASAALLGLLQADPEQHLHWSGTAASAPGADAIQALVDARIAARQRRDFAEADRIRAALADMGVLLEDGPTGTSWRRA